MAGVWFRKGLRLHDNPALCHAASQGESVFPIFILDPHFDRSKIGVNRFQFLLEALSDLDAQLREKHRSRLLVLRGIPEVVFRDLFDGTGPFKLKSLFWEKDTEPYARKRDSKVQLLAKELGVQTQAFVGHTLLDLDATVNARNFKPPISMRHIQKLVEANGPVPQGMPVPNIPPLEFKGCDVPQIEEFYTDAPSSHGFPGGEREALQRLQSICHFPDWVCSFEKPNTASTGTPGKPWEPSTTGLSPYFKFGCLSVRTAWHAFTKCQEGRRHSQPPQSLLGQLLFREMFYILSISVPNWDKDEGNTMCNTIPWGDDPELVTAWEEGQTGFPFIDALMRQLRQTGWMHHLGRHAVACFLTRGDLWQNWTKGRDVFDKYLLDADWALNNGNWLWLAGVAPFSSPYSRVYDPCPGGKSSLNAEQSGEFVRHFVPELANMPAKYIYKPWTAPPAVQQAAKCIIGKDYPSPIVDHKMVKEANIERFGHALEELKVAQLPAKFGNAGEDPGKMKSTYQSSASFLKTASENREGAIHNDWSQGSTVNQKARAGYNDPQPKRRWTRRPGPGT